MEFPLKKWFNLDEKISKDDRRGVEDQMRLYAFKEGKNDDDLELQESIKRLRQEVKRFNRMFKGVHNK